MANSDIRIEFDSEELLAALSGLQARFEDMTPLMSELSGILEDASERAFINEKDPDTGTPWAPLSETTKARRNDPLAKILQDSGSLVGSLSTDHDARSATVGFAEKYAGTHHHGAAKGEFGNTSRGAPIPWGDIPARPIVGLAESDIQEIEDAVSAYISASF